MRIFYQVLLHHYPEQFTWLFSAIYNRLDYFLIHVARECPDEDYAKIQAIASGFPNVRFQRRNATAWGGWSLAQTELDGVAAAVEWADDWSYFINLSGQCYPLHDRAGTVAALQALDGRSAVVSHPISELPSHIRRRTWFHCVEWAGRMRRLPVPRSDLMRTTINWKGSFWNILSREFCEWTISSDRTPQMVRRLRSTAIPDEFFFANLIRESPFSSWRVNDNMRYARWRSGAPSPEMLTVDDQEEMVGSGKLFARKFDARHDREILIRLAERIGARRPEVDQVAA